MNRGGGGGGGGEQQVWMGEAAEHWSLGRGD